MKNRTDIELRIQRLDDVITRLRRRSTHDEADALVAASCGMVRDALAWTLGTHGTKRHDRTFAALCVDAALAFEPREVTR